MKKVEKSEYYQDKRKYDKYLAIFNYDKQFMNDFNKKFLNPLSFK